MTVSALVGWFVLFRQITIPFSLVCESDCEGRAGPFLDVVRRAEHLRAWEATLCASFADSADLGRNFFCIRNCKLTRIGYRRYERFRLSKSWYYCHVRCSAIVTDSIYAYAIPPIPLRINDNSAISFCELDP